MANYENATYVRTQVTAALFGWVDEWISRGMRETPEELCRPWA